MTLPILTINLSHEQDVVLARRRALQIAEFLQFDKHDATRIATSVSEVARHAFAYAKGGVVEFSVVSKDESALFIRIIDNGPGLPNQLVSSGSAITAARRLMDQVEIQETADRGTVASLSKRISRPGFEVSKSSIGTFVRRLREQPTDILEEVRQQNEVLLRSLEDLRTRQEELERLNRELAETDRGVVALYAELDDRDQHLRASAGLKTKFFSHVSHELRTPLNAIVGLTRLLMLRDEIRSNEESSKQVSYIQRSALELSEMVSDLLDLVKVEAGRFTINPEEFELGGLFAAMRGMFRPLATGDVNLVFDNPVGLPALLTDERKLTQILRNFVSNALKFTECGSVQVWAEYDEKNDLITVNVRDTGIGIAPEHHQTIFEEFSQVSNPIQQRTTGTGLGLPLCRKFAELLGGRVRLRSALGLGSTFAVEIPRSLAASIRKRVLVVDDEDIARYLLKQILSAKYDIIEAADGEEGIVLARKEKPAAIFLDLNMAGLSGVDVVNALASDEATNGIPVAIVTGRELDRDTEQFFAVRGVPVLSKAILGSADQLDIEFGPPFSVRPRRKSDGTDIERRG